MRPATSRPAGDPHNDVRQIPKWARRYAQNRTLRIVVTLGMCLGGCAAFFGLGNLTVWAFRSDNGLIGWVSLAVLWAFIGWWVWFSFVGANRMIPRITERFYRREGAISTAGVPDTELPHVPGIAIWLLLLVMFGHFLLTQRGILPERYLQPISVLYLIPFMVWVGLKLRPQPHSPFMFLWPVLYAMHGVLILAGVPISFGPERAALDYLTVPVYGFVAALAGHIYSRVALRRLRALAAAPESSDRQ